ncbi:DUF6414 family protein [Burkholderia vietnamiensis]|uniref:DUF6414 family protein n=1 Tax=Burkholderia vietnamiensis TaxID=60552 RepID=UPI001594BCEB|nr:hypothetical protein [Burkholderia vietnamiensis]
MGLGSQSIDSIFDFLYADTYRLKSWLAQLLDDGVPTGHRRTSQTGESDNSEVSGNVDVTAKASALIAKAEVKGAVTGKLGTLESSLSSVERSFDASWSLPLNVLDRLDEAGLITRDISTAKIGSVVLITGTPQLHDIKLLQDVWKPAIGFMTSQEKITHRNKSEITSKKMMLQSIGEVLQVMPPTPQITMADVSGRLVWGCLNDDHMVISASSLALTHGTSVKGTWHVLAVLDATPDEDIDDPHEFDSVMAYSQLMASTADVLGSIRDLMGRPSQAYGITPVVIFRSIGA